MSQLKILIVEDDPMIAESVQDIIAVLNHEVLGVAESAETAIAICNETVPDLALLDIQIGGDIDGVQLAELLNQNFEIPFIFTTAFADNETITRAKEKGPFGYLVKPYGVKDINAAIEVAMAAFDRLKKAESASTMSKVIQDSIYLKVDSKLIKVKIDDILYVEAKGDYALFKTKEKGHIVHTTMKRVEDRLTPHNFAKVHRSYVINLSKIIDIEESNLLIDNKVIPISRSNKEALIKRLNLL
ncbi:MULTISPECIES: response regulator [Roseivirga]|jgi:DNA-binding LytR/AlgR family response regulator|uniref:DNA-binding response regulator n=1 Tax=Roseivirga thermotolerans TaxID=1758176 RepID=A0ABQ3IAV5_9BACT|nr:MULTISPECIES: response regulator [Roseivirga]MEC7755404.1 response regulator [Bacteroidota bacterium]GHE73417.1 DNA-binding response regulator [Roseivirga thermotolerans]|tara:strand:- start:1716 stop:2444 length:729 start_codon:yes stop_codon:yes gene_type:complete